MRSGKGEVPPSDGFDSLYHDDTDNAEGIDPYYTNPDRDSPRWRFYYNLGKNGWYGAGPTTTSFLPGWYMADYYYDGSPLAEPRKGFYYTYEVDCEPRIGPDQHVPSYDEVVANCDKDYMRQVALTKTHGPTQILTIGIDSPYIP